MLFVELALRVAVAPLREIFEETLRGSTIEKQSLQNKSVNESRDARLAESYLREANAFGEWKSTEGFADPLLELLNTSPAATGSATENQTPRANHDALNR